MVQGHQRELHVSLRALPKLILRTYSALRREPMPGVRTQSGVAMVIYGFN